MNSNGNDASYKKSTISSLKLNNINSITAGLGPTNTQKNNLNVLSYSKSSPSNSSYYSSPRDNLLAYYGYDKNALAEEYKYAPALQKPLIILKATALNMNANYSMYKDVQANVATWAGADPEQTREAVDIAVTGAAFEVVGGVILKGASSAATKATKLNDIFESPKILKNMTPDEVKALAQKEGWEVGTLSKGSHAGEGLTIRNGKDRLIQWHPGEGHHGSDPYWKVSSGSGGTGRYDMSGNIIK